MLCGSALASFVDCDVYVTVQRTQWEVNVYSEPGSDLALLSATNVNNAFKMPGHLSFVPFGAGAL